MARLKYDEEKFSKVKVCGIECEFSDMRIDRGSIPVGKYFYEVAGDDESGMGFCGQMTVITSGCNYKQCKSEKGDQVLEIYNWKPVQLILPLVYVLCREHFFMCRRVWGNLLSGQQAPSMASRDKSSLLD